MKNSAILILKHIAKFNASPNSVILIIISNLRRSSNSDLIRVHNENEILLTIDVKSRINDPLVITDVKKPNDSLVTVVIKDLNRLRRPAFYINILFARNPINRAPVLSGSKRTVLNESKRLVLDRSTHPKLDLNHLRDGRYSPALLI
jgi:hypothetical protein